jgi:iron complex transport system substrate-binding protein
LRLVSLTPVATEVLALLGLEDNIVGITSYCTMYLSNNMNKEIVGTCLNVNLKKIEKLRPDLIITYDPVQREISERLLKSGYNVYSLRAPRSVNDIIAYISEIGVITGKYVEAKELIAKLSLRLANLLSETASIPPNKRLRVYVEHFYSFNKSTTFGGLSYIDDGIWLAGGLNIYSNVPKSFFEPNYDDVASRDPDMVIVSVAQDLNLDLKRYVELRPKIRELRAYKTRQIYLVREGKRINLSHPGPTFINAVEYLHNLILKAKPRLRRGAEVF